jgi:hypothetical protein
MSMPLNVGNSEKTVTFCRNRRTPQITATFSLARPDLQGTSLNKESPGQELSVVILPEYCPP